MNNNFLFLLFLIIVIVALKIITLKLKDKSKIKKEHYPFRKKDFLLNISERKLFEALLQRMPINYVIYPQIKLNSIVQFSGENKLFRGYQNKIDRKTLDFVIFEKKYLKPILAIEYDGPTHSRKDRKTNDNFKNNVLAKAGIKLIRIKHSRNLDLDNIINTEILPSLQ